MRGIFFGLAIIQLFQIGTSSQTTHESSYDQMASCEGVQTYGDIMWILPMRFQPKEYAGSIPSSLTPLNYGNGGQIDEMPWVVAAIPSFKRHHFLTQSLEYIYRQAYPKIAVVILDEDFMEIEKDHRNIHGLIPSDLYREVKAKLRAKGILVYYHFVKWDPQRPINVGKKRQMVMRRVEMWAAVNEGELGGQDFVVMHWDDDDWFANDRMIRQVTPLISGEATITALDMRGTLTLDNAYDEGYKFRFLENDPRKGGLRPMAIMGGSLTYWWSVHGSGEGQAIIPPIACGEDIEFLMGHLKYDGSRLEIISDSSPSLLYMRHSENTWKGLEEKFHVAIHEMTAPLNFCAEDKVFYEKMKNWTADKKRMEAEGSLKAYGKRRLSFSPPEKGECYSCFPMDDTAPINNILLLKFGEVRGKK